MTPQNPGEVFTRPNTEAKIFDLPQYTLYTDTPNRPGYRARLQFAERNGAPRISVFPNTEAPPFVLTVGMSPVIFETFLSEFEEIALNGAPGTRASMVNLQKDPSFTGKAPNFDDVPKIPKNTLRYGKSEEGVMWLGIEQKDAPNIIFRILPSAWHVFQGTDGQPVGKEKMSVISALSMIKSLRQAMARWTGRLKFVNPDEGGKKEAKVSYADPNAELSDISFF